MEDICRLCSSTKFVNNYIFDEEKALYLKMSLYLPIKVFKNDRLPKKICDKCSCKVNDFYQFCNETIEVETRLRKLISSDLTVTITSNTPKRDQAAYSQYIDESTQTEDFEVKVKNEPDRSPSPIKEENDYPDNDYVPDHISDDSDDYLLINIKKNKKHKRKDEKNGHVQTKKQDRKRKDDLSNDQNLASELIDNNIKHEEVNLDIVKEESEDDFYLESKEEAEVFYCCICFTKCLTRPIMLQHYKEHASKAEKLDPPPAPPFPEQSPQRCLRCQKIITDPKIWETHWQGHWERDRRPYRCSLCEKTFRDHHSILKHGLAHKMQYDSVDGTKAPSAPAKRFVCDLCPEGFVYMRCLLAHRSSAHPESASRALALRCAVCARQFAHLNSLRRHLRAHSGERTHLCSVCGKVLSSREHLKFHVRIHTGYKPNVCKTCGKGFVKKCNLTLHERVHSGEKPHVCSHCGKAFSQRSTLVIHERYHSGARPYKCGVCGRGFVAKGLLSMHLKSSCVDLPPPARDSPDTKIGRVQVRLLERP
ncbi:zinc finger protein 239-like isoform X1 [Colias croceus]|uniref:zinc finger protein 239-like isoform X1 n=1 Tax=Colias crocea TaxID=72248 RepID=UPI001E27FADD|nr:zinc finger protein 239-like isoform X1 [Colias croceus]